MNSQVLSSPSPGAARATWLSTIAFTACFAVWTIFAIIGIGIKEELGLSETQFGLLAGTPILTGSLARVFLGIWADQFGGRRIMALTMIAAAIATFLVSYADSYAMLLIAGLGVGLAGGAFSVGVAYVATFYPPGKQGTALGIFGAGNVGAAVTKFVAPFVMVAFGWTAVAQIWAVALAAMAAVFYVSSPQDPQHIARKASGKRPEPMSEQLKVLRDVQVWRFALYYFFVFGAFVALSLWLPRYVMGVYDMGIKEAGMLAAFYSIPASLFRIYGGHLSDKYGARRVLYWTFGVSSVCTFLLSYPPTSYVIDGIKGPIAFSTQMGLVPFLITIFVLGFFMSLGKAAVYKHIPVYFPDRIGAVGGLVGMIGGLGGFVLPLIFGVMLDLTGVWTSSFALLFLIVTISLIWMHFAIQYMERSRQLQGRSDASPELPEMEGLGTVGTATHFGKAAPIHASEMPALAVSAASGTGSEGLPTQRSTDANAGLSQAGVLSNWRPEDPVFWKSQGKAIARRNLWISTYNLLLAFAVWMVWSVVVAKLPGIGFEFTTDQLFWLAALPGLSGATLRIFYSFLVPIFGGRLWTAVSTATLLVPAFGIGYAVQNLETPFFIFLVLALLCGLGGGNFASSMANISFFFPKAEKGNALAINAGIGNLGVSVMQFLVPVVVTMGLFGALGGQAQLADDGAVLYLQNAGFVWVPLIIIGTVAAWLGMNDIASAEASFADQAAIFGRRHTWLMCWLYTGTFGTFIGMSAGFPLLTKLVFPEIDVLKYAFIGPFVGAASRAATGWVADRFGGARVTFVVFLVMMAAIAGMIWFLNAGDFWGFFGMVLLLFFASGVGNASTFQMIPNIMRSEIRRLAPALSADEQRGQAERESAAIIGFTSAIAAYGAFYIPKAYGSSIEITGAANAALWGFFAFFVSCALLSWIIYSGPRGLLKQIETRRAAPAYA
ncbi:MFS transporter [Croceicoccus sp. F390]|uniref:MFS transporter n=1 Tax=Croceicoccus esteveae TaxID=3075597 RepID=A0ABU2ZHG7_9SPHN|nr:MFS transporter [Croceicoccus sp. F390]MDT0576052.1 MFS transporter [Croceicoccus sp. F390]